MKLFRIAVFASALSVAGVTLAPAQSFKISKEQLAEIVKKQAEEKAGESAGSGRRGGRAAATSNDGSSFSSWADVRKNFAAQSTSGGKERPRQYSSYSDFAASVSRGGGLQGGIQGAIQRVIKKQITVIDGDRVTDPVTGELLDDARKIRVDEDRKEEFYDDGTHGDLVAGDGQYTRVGKIADMIGPNNQRIKEQLIQAVYEISRLEPIEFYGHTLASVDHETRPERYKRWALIDAAEGNVGFRISEIDTEKGVEVPNYWEEQLSRDMKVAGPNGWARTFLDEYRVEKGGIDSNFYAPYVPQPPTIPTVPPPSAEGWSPFVASYSEEDGIGVEADGKGRGKAEPSAVGSYASAFVSRGAGKGSTSAQGGYFNAN